MGDVFLTRATPADAGLLYGVAAMVPESWPHLCPEGEPPPMAFASIVGSGASSIYVVHLDGTGPVGAVEFYDWHEPSGTVWLDVPVLPGPGAMDVREEAARLAVARAFDHESTRKIYALRHGYEAPLFGGLPCRWHEEACTPDAVLHDGHHWDDIVTAVYRGDWLMTERS